MSLKDDEQCSEDVIFYGPTSSSRLKEQNYMFIAFIGRLDKQQTIAADEHSEEDNNNTSLKLISTDSSPETTSEQDCLTSPRIIPKTLSNTTLSPDEPNLFANWDVTSSDSFLKIEKMVEETCNTTKEFDNTPEKIEYILKNTPGNVKKTPPSDDSKVAESKADLETDKIPKKVNFKLALNTEPLAEVTPKKHSEKEKEVCATSLSVPSTKPSISRTPTNPPLYKKPSTSSLKKLPGKKNAFQHVVSPVACYINNSPQIPLIQNVHPKKTLSSIPKFVTSTTIKPSNKENVNLPFVAYKSAKKTTVTDVSNRPKMPQSDWAKKLTKSLPRPAVIKHMHREKEFSNKPLLRKPEDSFGDLSLNQADVSVCTKKDAF